MKRWWKSMAADHRPLILASSSPYRKALLDRLGLNYTTVSPDVDEVALPGETPAALVQRLAEHKARTVSATHSGLIIGADQVATINDEILGKPGNHETAVAQLQRLAGNRVIFHTGLCLLDTDSDKVQQATITFEVQFRRLSGAQIERYLRAEQPYDCAGSFKSEGLGVTLFEKMIGDDPTALIGLPLIRLAAMLGNAGVDLP
jgi:MAF protein